MPQISDTLKNQFIDFLKTEDYMFVTKDGKLEHTYYCDHNDKISSQTMEKIIENYKDTAKTITDAVLLYAYDNNWFDYYQNQHHQSVMSFIIKTGLEYSDYLYDQLSDVFCETVTIDEDIPQLLAQSRPEDLTFSFNKKDATRDMYDIFDNDKDNLDDSTFGWFLNTQGYTVSDLYTKTDDPFIQSVNKELHDDLDPYELANCDFIAVPNSSNWEAIYQLATQQKGVIKAGTPFGFFDFAQGKGTSFDIITKKDITIDYPIIDSFTIAKHSDYSYTPGYCWLPRPTTGNDLEPLQKED